MTCAHVVNVAIQKMPGVESVEVSLNRGLAKVKLKPDSAVRPEQLWTMARENGYTPKETRVVVRGRVAEAGGTLRLEVPGASATYDLAPSQSAPGAYDAARRELGRTVVLEGTMSPPPAKEKNAGASIRVEGVRAAQQ